jgi:hypothetical protein
VKDGERRHKQRLAVAPIDPIAATFRASRQ